MGVNFGVVSASSVASDLATIFAGSLGPQTLTAPYKSTGNVTISSLVNDPVSGPAVITTTKAGTRS